ncbi:MAG: PP2C family protein-serine/threonine phosphatase, partial [Actinocrinis sp.]
RVGTALAIMVITGASYLVAQRRVRLQLAYDQVLRIAEVTQRVLLRPVPARIGPVTAAVEYLSAATGAHVGGDFYEVIETPYGIRAILGDVRGNGLDALSAAAALLGAFREAGAVEPALETVAARLDAALARHAAGTRRAELTASHRPMIEARRAAEPDACTKNDARAKNTVREIRESEVWAEDFATAVLVQIPYPNPAPSNPAPSGSVPAVAAPAVPGRAPGEWHGVGANEVKLVVCGHPSPYLVHGDTARAVEPERATLPLGLGSLVAGPYAASSRTVAFEPGDSLVLYTDGVSDARDRSGAFFPLGELLDAVGGCAEPESVARLVRARLLKHMNGELNDDAALLVLSRV